MVILNSYVKLPEGRSSLSMQLGARRKSRVEAERQARGTGSCEHSDLVDGLKKLADFSREVWSQRNKLWFIYGEYMVYIWFTLW